MGDADLGRARLVAQGLVTRPFARPAHAVSAHVAMQGQDLPGVLASAVLRTRGGPADVLADLDAGRLVRAYPMRGTVFLMAAADAAWVSALCNPTMLRSQERRRAQLELGEKQVSLAREALLAVLENTPAGLSRGDVLQLWQGLGVDTASGRGYHILSYLIGRGDVVFGPWNGKDQNVVATVTWLPRSGTLAQRFDGERVPAVAELLLRYLTSQGPATGRDFAWWTKLPLREVRAALPLVARHLEGGPGLDDLWWRPGLHDEVAAVGAAADDVILLPGFDEFVLGYADRLFAMTARQHMLVAPGNNGVFGRTVVGDGQVRGLWKRGGRPGSRVLEHRPFAGAEGIRPSQAAALAQRWAEFPFVTP